jgi:hypothetical protein
MHLKFIDIPSIDTMLYAIFLSIFAAATLAAPIAHLGKSL